MRTPAPAARIAPVEKPDSFRTAAARADTTITIQRSEFIAAAFPIVSEEAFKEELATLERRYFAANHHCWAYRLYRGGDVLERSSDDGEPSGTAGKPIAMAIASRGLFDTGVVVVRYFGGIKLGSGGLVRAYREATLSVLDQLEIVERLVYTIVEVEVPFSKLSGAYRLVAPPDVKLAGESFGERNIFRFLVRRSRFDAFARSLVDQRMTFSEAGLTIE